MFDNVLKTTPYVLPHFRFNVAMFGRFTFLAACAGSGGRQVEFQNEEERREAIDHIRLMARRKYLGEREARTVGWAYGDGEFAMDIDEQHQIHREQQTGQES